MAEGSARRENAAKGWQPNLYDTLGLIVPGGWLLLGLFHLRPDIAVPLAAGRDAFGLAELGLFTLAAFTAGHLVAAVGNLLSAAMWIVGGMPTDWVMRANSTRVVSPGQRPLLDGRMQERLGLEFGTAAANKQEWRAAVRRIYAEVAAAGRADRVDVFNANYGMLRGVAGASLVLAALAAMDFQAGRPGFDAAVFFLACAAVAAYRMHRFALTYAQELFAQFLQLESDAA